MIINANIYATDEKAIASGQSGGYQYVIFCSLFPTGLVVAYQGGTGWSREFADGYMYGAKRKS